MSNIPRERPQLNRQVWKNLERTEIRDYAKRFNEIWIVTGPIFGVQSMRLETGIKVPSACYKILVDEQDGRPRLLAFIIPQDVTGQGRPERFLTSVDAVELETGLDFSSGRQDDLGNKLEAERSKGMWR
jgi:endonuclease G, mitochondrial